MLQGRCGRDHRNKPAPTSEHLPFHASALRENPAGYLACWERPLMHLIDHVFALMWSFTTHLLRFVLLIWIMLAAVRSLFGGSRL